MNCYRCGRETMELFLTPCPGPRRSFRVLEKPICRQCRGKSYSRRGILVGPPGKVIKRSLKQEDREASQVVAGPRAAPPRRSSRRPASPRTERFPHRVLKELAQWPMHPRF